MKRVPETDQQRIEREKRIDVAEDMAYELIGGCLSMAIVAERCGVDLADALAESILNRAFQCQGCGWWHSTEELNNLTERELCDACHLEENPETDEDAPPETNGNEPPAGRGGVDIGSVLAAMPMLRAPSDVMIVTDEEADPMEVLRLTRRTQEAHPDASVSVVRI
jgi:hypothetical protein